MLIPVVAPFIQASGANPMLVGITLIYVVNMAMILPSGAAPTALMHANSDWLIPSDAYKYATWAEIISLGCRRKAGQGNGDHLAAQNGGVLDQTVTGQHGNIVAHRNGPKNKLCGRQCDDAAESPQRFLTRRAVGHGGIKLRRGIRFARQLADVYNGAFAEFFVVRAHAEVKPVASAVHDVNAAFSCPLIELRSLAMRIKESGAEIAISVDDGREKISARELVNGQGNRV